MKLLYTCTTHQPLAQGAVCMTHTHMVMVVISSGSRTRTSKRNDLERYHVQHVSALLNRENCILKCDGHDGVYGRMNRLIFLCP